MWVYNAYIYVYLYMMHIRMCIIGMCIGISIIAIYTDCYRGCRSDTKCFAAEGYQLQEDIYQGYPSWHAWIHI